MIALSALILFALSPAPDPLEVLHSTAAVYEKARSLEYSAALSVEVPDKDLVISFHQTVCTPPPPCCRPIRPSQWWRWRASAVSPYFGTMPARRTGRTR